MTFKRLTFNVQGHLGCASYKIAKNGDVIIDSDVWLDGTSSCDETSSLIGRQECALTDVDDHAQNFSNKKEVKRTKSLIGFRDLVKKVTKRKNIRH